MLVSALFLTKKSAVICRVLRSQRTSPPLVTRPARPLYAQSMYRLSEAFENVRHVNGGFSIRYTGLRTLGAAFTNLRTTGEYHVYGNALLASLGTAFGTLRAVGHSLYIQHNAVLTGPGDVAFSDLESIGGGSGRLNFYLNGTTPSDVMLPRFSPLASASAAATSRSM